MHAVASGGRPSKLRSIQLLRAAAAIAVVFTHSITRIGYTFPQGRAHSLLDGPSGQVLAGDAGVDVFFVISGFIMYYVHHQDFGVAGAPVQFLKKRILRIVPIYWLLTAVAIAITAALPNLAVTHDSKITLSWIASSYLFLPVAWRDSISPIIGVGWTLDYEMLFYLVFACSMFLPLRKGLSLVVIFFVIAVVAGAVVAPSAPTAKFFSDWLLLDFIMGVGIAWWSLSRHAIGSTFRTCLVVSGLVGLAISLIWTPPEHGPLRFLLWGIPASLLVAGLCAAHIGSNKIFQLGEKLGDASYSIYLFQFFALPATAIFMRHAGFGALPFDANVLILTGLATLAGVACWWGVERPLGRWLRKLDFFAPAVSRSSAVRLS